MVDITKKHYEPSREAEHEETFTESVAKRYMGKNVDIYLGDSNGSHYYSDFYINKTSFIRGVIVDVDCYALFVIAQAVVDSKEVEFEIAINSYNIKAICPVHNVIDKKFNIGKLIIDKT
jgi:hypothetical protein